MTEIPSFVAAPPEKFARAVTFRDILAVHPGKPEKCLCRGTGRVTAWVGSVAVERECGRALEAFRKKCASRVVDTAIGPHWKIGETPEEALAKFLARSA